MPDGAPSLESDGIQADTAKVREWSLVLTAMGIRHRVRRTEEGAGFLIRVAPDDLDRALEEIRLYEQENVPLEPASATGPRQAGDSTFWILLALAFFYKFVRLDLTGFGYDPIPWQKLGRVDAWLIQKGEWWRIVTGLTLHADLAHLIGNLLIGGLFVVLLSRDVGPGLAWLLVFVSGAAGNALNVMVQGFPHASVGWSTSVFGVVGVLSGLRLMEEKRPGWSRRLLPLPAGLGLLAMLGSGGGNTDLGAHLFGFAAGLPAGLTVGYLDLGRRFPSLPDRLFLAGTLGLVACCWLLALSFGSVD